MSANKDAEEVEELLMHINYPLGLSSRSEPPANFHYFMDLLGNENKSSEEKILHVTIPFCDSVCAFCAAGRTLKTKDNVERYIQALKSEIDMYSKARYIDSSIFNALYFGGGGTPTVLSSEQLCDLLAYCKAKFTFCEDPEINIESTTHNAGEDKLRKLLECGVGRLYFGVQTFDDTIRKILNRTDSGKQVAQTIKTAHAMGYTNVHIDLMYNLPGQTTQIWKDDLRRAIDLNVESVSIFRFCVHPHLKLARMLQSGEIPSIEADNVANEMYREAVDVLSNAGYKPQYTSGFALPGKENKYYDLFYKYQREGLGLGATNWFCSLIGSYTYKNFESFEKYSAYLSDGKFPISMGMKLSKDDEMRRMMIRGLNSGVDKSEFNKRFGRMPEDVFPETMDSLRKEGLIIIDEHEIKLTNLSITYDGSMKIYNEFLPKHKNLKR